MLKIKIICDILVVLCPGDPEVGNDGIIKFKDLSDNKNEYSGKFLYDGGNIRMRAAFSEEIQAEKIIVVGGSKTKVDFMKLYLIQRGVSDNKIIRIESSSDTNGNLHAIRKILERHNKIDKLKDRKIAILTNEYHQPRTQRMGKDILESVKIMPQYINAEDYASDNSKFEEEMADRIYQ